MTRSNKFPASSFGAELQSVLREGGNRVLRLSFETEALATRFMHRLNALRAALKREKHSDWEQLYRCGIHKDATDKKILILAPRDSEFRAAITAAGVTVTPPPEVSEYTIRTSVSDPAEDFLATLRDATTVPKKD